jgi:hypothetical protein
VSTWLTIGFCLVIVVMLIDFWRRGGAIPQGPAILTMVGIAGTFLGIALGLAHFNTADITGSIPRLIDGMKIAVWASFAGVVSAILLKYRDSLLAARLANDYEIDGSPPQNIDALRDLIGTDEHTSLLSELKLLRRDVGERISRIEHSLEFFPERVARQNAKALVEALQESAVIAPITDGSHEADEYARKGHVEST